MKCRDEIQRIKRLGWSLIGWNLQGCNWEDEKWGPDGKDNKLLMKCQSCNTGDNFERMKERGLNVGGWNKKISNTQDESSSLKWESMKSKGWNCRYELEEM